MVSHKRECYLDFLRIVACFLVILNHTPGYIASFNIDNTKAVSLIIWHLFVEMVVKIGVPIFYMISGTLLLKKDMSYKDVANRIIRMFFILIIFSIVANIVDTKQFYFPGFIRKFASATVEGAGPYWYIYTYIGLLIIMPFMRSVAIRLTKTDIIYLIFVRLFITGIIAVLIWLMNIKFNSNMYLSDHFQPVFITVDCIFYCLVGFGLDSLWNIKELTNKKLFILIITFVGTAFIESWLTFVAGSGKIFSGMDFLMTISLFIGVKAAFYRKEPSEKMKNMITLIGCLTFGIYLLDPIIGTYLKPFVHKLYPTIPSYLGVSMLYCVISMLVCGILTYLYKMMLIWRKNFDRNRVYAWLWPW